MRSRRPIALLLAMLVVAPACAQDAKRSGDDPRAITRTRTRLTWTGTSAFRSSPPRPSDLRQLRSAGQSFTFDVALGNDYWKRRPGSLHVGIRWTERGGQVSQDVTGDLFALFVVDPNDDIVAGIRGDDRDISSAQSVELNAPPDGKYEVLVVPHRVRGRRFEGVVTVKHATTSDVLPDLAPRQPDGFTFKAQGAEDSCLLVEVQEQPGLRRCLRFDARISNVGEGAFVTEADITDEVDRRSGGLEPEGDVVQIVEGQDGKRRRIPTGRWVIDKEHAHTHLVDLASYELRRVTTAGAGDPLVTDVKIGFCPWDLIDERFGRSTATARRFPAYACAVPSSRDGSKRVVLKIGISAGWADVYPARRPIQYLDVTSVPDGLYDVVVRVDPNGWFEDADRSNNVATTRIRLEGKTITCVAEPYGCPDGAVAR